MIDRAVVMREAHKQWRQSKRLGLEWDWSRCLRFAWHKAKGKKEIEDRRFNLHQRKESTVVPGGLAGRALGRNCNIGAYL